MLGRIVHDRFFQLFLMGALLAGAISIQVSDAPVLERLRNIGFDYYNKLMPRKGPGHSVIIDIDEASLQKYGQWPWPRTLVAQLTTELKALGAASIAYDITFVEPDRTSPHVLARMVEEKEGMGPIAAELRKLRDHDAVFADAIRNAGNVVTAFVGAEQEQNVKPLPKATIGGSVEARSRLGLWQENFAVSLPELVDAAAGNGSFSMVPDGDGLLRRIPILLGRRKGNDKITDEQPLPGLALEALRVAAGTTVLKVIDTGAPDFKIEEIRFNARDAEGNKKKIAIPTDPSGNFIMYYAGKRDEIYVPAWQVLQGKVDADRIKGKIAFVGTSTIGLLDLRSTPLNPVLPGVEVHAEIVDQVLNNQFIVRADNTRGVEGGVTIAVSLAIIFMAPFVSAGTLALFSLLIIAGIIGGGFYAYGAFGDLFDVVFPSCVIVTIFILASIFSNLRSEMEKRMIRQAFSHYLSPVLIAELAKNPEKLRLGGEVRDLSVMFTDIRNFTTISESMEPAELIRMMNDFLTPMTSAVLDNRGTVDKYMGDAMMAFWNAPLDDAKHAENACRTALLMVASLAPVNDNLKARMEAAGKPFRELKAGIGINSGTASVGNMGSKQRFAYSALGDTVNLASRIEGQTKGYGISIMISDSVRKAAPQFAAIEIDLLTVKGRKEPERVHDETEAQSAEFTAFAGLHAQMLAAYRAQEWDKAAEQADACATERPELFLLYKLYKERIIAYRENPPPADWGGVWVAKDK